MTFKQQQPVESWKFLKQKGVYLGKTTHLEQINYVGETFGFNCIIVCNGLAMSSAGGSVSEMVRRLRTRTLQALIFYHSYIIIQLLEGTRKDGYLLLAYIM